MEIRVGLAPDIGEDGRLALETACCELIEAGGAEPVMLDPAEADPLAGVHALVLCGGAFDIPPDWYGESARARIDPARPARSEFERRALERADALGLPVLGICGGEQLMAVCRGGTLVQDIAAALPDALEHEQSGRSHESVHAVQLAPDSRLAGAVGATSLEVNSTHHQCVALCRGGVTPVGWAPDGVVEAIEDARRAFWIGVQWHPEKLRDTASRYLVEAFLRAARDLLRNGAQRPG